MQNVSYATSIVEAQTDFFSEDRELAYKNGLKFLGAPDNSYAAIPSTMSSFFKIAVRMERLSLPPNAQVQSLSFGVYARSSGTVHIATDPSFSTGSILAAVAVSGGNAFATLNTTPSLSVVNGPLFLRMSFNASDRKEIDAFVVYADYTVPTSVKRKDASGAWVSATAKRKTATGWANAEVAPVYTPPARFADARAKFSAIDSATDVAGIEATTSAIETLYGIRTNILTADYTYSGFTHSAGTFDHPNLKASYKTVVDELTKYPPTFVDASLINAVFLCNTVTNNTAGVQVAGITHLGSHQAFLNLNGSGSPMYQGTVFDTMEFTFHHEFQHLIYASFKADFDVMEQYWNTLNPEPYIGDQYTTLTGRPQGHAREYGRYSFLEDIADIHGIIMSTNLQPNLEQWLADDPILAHKIEVYKGFLASKAFDMGHKRYYKAINQY